MAVDEIGPVPPGVAAGAPDGSVFGILEWFNRMLDRLQRSATTTAEGSVNQAAAIADLNQTISATPTQAEVQAISDKIDAILAGQRTAGQMDT